MKRKKPYIYVLSLDFDNEEGADYLPITGKNWKSHKKFIDNNFSNLLYAMDPPPKVEVIGLTQAEWKKAQKVGRER